jgi:hypothetical protein
MLIFAADRGLRQLAFGVMGAPRRSIEPLADCCRAYCAPWCVACVL